MEQQKFPYTVWIKGKLYFSVKVNGKKLYEPLPLPSDPRFATEYARLTRQHQAKKEAKKKVEEFKTNVITGSFKALIAAYERSLAYRELARSTKVNTDYYFRLFNERWGDTLVSSLTPRMIDEVLESEDMAAKPGKAINFIKHLKTLIDAGIRWEYRKDNFNPAQGARRPRIGEHDPWPEDVIEAVLAHASPMLRLAVILGLYTGQRISDCILIEREALLAAAEDSLELTQVKTGVTVFIPIHPELLREVATVLYNRFGLPFPKPDQIQTRLKELMIELGHYEWVVIDGERKKRALYTFHGLRKCSTNHLAELGASAHEIGAINGMDVNTVIHYSRKVNRKRLAANVSERFRASDHKAKPARRAA
jgi:integrase